MSAEDNHPAAARGLQERFLAPPEGLPATATDLFRELRAYLLRAADAGRITDPPHAIFHMLKLEPADGPGAHAIFGGEKNFHRTRDKGHFTRDDGAWFDFALTVQEQRGQPLGLQGYNFEIRFPDETVPRWLRFDLNLPRHDNATAGLRAHLHPGTDDVSLPYPILAPLEMLHLFVFGLRRRDPDALRRV